MVGGMVKVLDKVCPPCLVTLVAGMWLVVLDLADGNQVASWESGTGQALVN